MGWENFGRDSAYQTWRPSRVGVAMTLRNSLAMLELEKDAVLTMGLMSPFLISFFCKFFSVPWFMPTIRRTYFMHLPKHFQVREKNVMQLKKLNAALFPIRYNDKYYTDALASADFTKLAYFTDICVGSIACRLERTENGSARVYIMTLGILAPYRGRGIGTKLLSHVLDLSTDQNMSEVYLHVQINNEDAISFYKKFGFEITNTIQNYYTNITPPDCYVLTKYVTLLTKK